jgi:hypothetical protein
MCVEKIESHIKEKKIRIKTPFTIIMKKLEEVQIEEDDVSEP